MAVIPTIAASTAADPVHPCLNAALICSGSEPPGALFGGGFDRPRQHRLYFFPLPQGHGSLRPTFAIANDNYITRPGVA